MTVPDGARRIAREMVAEIEERAWLVLLAVYGVERGDVAAAARLSGEGKINLVYRAGLPLYPPQIEITPGGRQGSPA